MQDPNIMPSSRLGCPLSLKTPNMGNTGLVLIRQQAYADSGQIVVVVIDGEATVKRLGVVSDYYVLKPESSSRLHQPIVFDREAMIQGIVCHDLQTELRNPGLWRRRMDIRRGVGK